MLLAAILTISAYTAFAAANNPGDALGDVLYSDIVTYINDHAIPASITDGRTMVVAEDLRNYGFDVVWNGDDFTLSIEYTGGGIDPLPVEANTAPAGTFKCHYVYTAIKTYLSGELVDSFAIDGQTLIDFELLAKYGDIIWDGAERSLRLTIAASEVVTAPEPVATAAAAYNPALNTVEFKLYENRIKVNGSDVTLDTKIDAQGGDGVFVPVYSMGKAMGMNGGYNHTMGMQTYINLSIPGMTVDFERGFDTQFVYWVNDIPYQMSVNGVPERPWSANHLGAAHHPIYVRAEFFAQALGIEYFYDKNTETHIFNPKEPIAANMENLTPPLKVAPAFDSSMIKNLVLWSPQNRDITVAADSVTAPFGGRGRLFMTDDKGSEWEFTGRDGSSMIALEDLYGNGHGIRFYTGLPFPNGTYTARVEYYGETVYSAPLTFDYTITGKHAIPNAYLDTTIGEAGSAVTNVVIVYGLEVGLPYTIYFTDQYGNKLHSEFSGNFGTHRGWSDHAGWSVSADTKPLAHITPDFDIHPGYHIHIQYAENRTNAASDWQVIELKAENIGAYNRQ